MEDGRRKAENLSFFVFHPHPSSFILSFLLLSGCGQPYNASVSGTVTIDGAALRTGTIAFSPIAGGAIAYALIGEDGRYSVRTGSDEGLLAGEYAAAVVAMSGRPPGSKNFRDFGTPLVPARYGDPKQSGLRFTIVPASTTSTFRCAGRQRGLAAETGPAWREKTQRFHNDRPSDDHPLRRPSETGLVRSQRSGSERSSRESPITHSQEWFSARAAKHQQLLASVAGLVGSAPVTNRSPTLRSHMGQTVVGKWWATSDFFCATTLCQSS